MFAIHPYLRNSHSVVALLTKFQEVGEYAKVRIKTAPKNKKTVIINWGVRDRQYNQQPYRSLNGCDLRIMSDKLRFFKHVGKDCEHTPRWTTSADEAKQWGGTVVARYKTAASGGEGIVIWDPTSGEKFPEGAPLYTEYNKKTDEFRCHVFKAPGNHGEYSVRLIQRKAARKNAQGEAEVKNWQVRNLENGFVFVKNDVKAPAAVTKLATEFMAKYFSDMDFCALDIIYHKPSKTALVLEGNTAPGLEGTTVDVYVDYFKEVKA